MMKYPFRNLVFQGGGAKTFAYHGALAALEERAVLPQIERVAGASAGALLAALVSLRLSVADTLAIYHNANFASLITPKALKLPEWVRNAELLEREVERLLHNVDSLTRFVRHFGWYSTDHAYEWMQEVFAEHCQGNGRATFAEFRALGFRDLYVVATNMSQHKTEIFSADGTPDAAVVDALLMSQAVPLYFEALRFNGRKFGDGDHYADGGILLNYPIHLFDAPEYADNNRWFVNGVNWETLGCRLYTPPDCPRYSGPITNVLTYIANLFEALVEAQDVIFESSKTDQLRTINISNCCVRPTDLHVQPQPGNAKYDELTEAGREAAAAYLTAHKAPTIKPAIQPGEIVERLWERFG
jgi:NTE family protein